MNQNPFRIIWIALGFLCLALGTIGAALPILPTVPFYMVTLFCFARSSKRLHTWFTGTKLYKKHLDSYVNRRAMTMETKWKIIVFVTIIMAVGFVMMSQAPAGRICLGIVWICHLFYFLLGVKTI